MGSSNQVPLFIIMLMVLWCRGTAQNIREDGNTLILMNVIDTLDGLSVQIQENQDKVEATLGEMQTKLNDLEESQRTLQADMKKQQEFNSFLQQCSCMNQTSELQELLAKGQQNLEHSLQQCSTKDQISELRDSFITDECKHGSHHCSKMAICIDTLVSYKCECLSGYSGDGFTCQDVDECTDGNFICSANEYCSNTPGNYTCNCREGHRKGDMCQVCDDHSVLIEPFGCLRAIEERMVWDAAMSKCQELGMRLAEGIKREHMDLLNQYFYPKTNYNYFWIGLRDGRWLTSGEEVSEEDWTPGQSHSEDEHCGSAFLSATDTGLADYSCSDTDYALCQALP